MIGARVNRGGNRRAGFRPPAERGFRLCLRLGKRDVSRHGEHGVIRHVVRLVELHQRVARQRIERLRRRRDARGGVVAVYRLVEALLREELRLRALVHQPGAGPSLVAVNLLLRERRVEQHVRHEGKNGIQVVGEAAAGDGGGGRRQAGADADARREAIELLGKLLGGLRRGALAHEAGGESRQARQARRIVVAARAVDDHLKADERRPVILKHDQVHAVRQVGLVRLRQRDLQGLLGNRRLVLQDRARRGRGILRR